VAITPKHHKPWTARITTVVATIFLSITASTAVVGLDPAEPVENTAPVAAVAQTAAPEVIETPVESHGIPDDPCSGYIADFCVEVAIADPSPLEHVPSCTIGGHSPTGTLDIVPGSLGNGDIGIRVEIETGLAIDGQCFADAALGILTDERGWNATDGAAFARVDDDSYDLRLILASPNTTDSLCYPARTVGKYSCRKGDTVIINLMRWETGTEDYAGDLTTYRTYLINHEVGHFLGRGHVGCPAAGEPAPVMMQQTKGLGECLPNGWPTKDEY